MLVFARSGRLTQAEKLCWKTRLLEYKVRVRSVVLFASRFEPLLNVRPTLGAQLYRELPLSTLNPKQRGDALSTLARNVLSERHGDESFSNAARGQRVDGSLRGVDQASYDWLWGNLRVECKSSQMHWCRKRKAWFFRFANVKLAGSGRSSAAFDVLLLVLYTPGGIYIYEHDLNLGVSTCGAATPVSGYAIVLFGGVDRDWEPALSGVLGRLDATSNTCKRVAWLSSRDRRVLSAEIKHSSAIMMDAFKGVPLSEVSPPFRGICLQQIVNRIDSVLHPGSFFAAPGTEFCIDGRKRSTWTASCDWVRDGVRVECKSGQLLWEKPFSRWKVNFSHIKLDKDVFDELWLALYTPGGVYIYQHDFEFALTSRGVLSESGGGAVVISGPSNVRDWQKGLDAILHKLDSSGCRRIAHICWD